MVMFIIVSGTGISKAPPQSQKSTIFSAKNKKERDMKTRTKYLWTKFNVVQSKIYKKSCREKKSLPYAHLIKILPIPNQNVVNVTLKFLDIFYFVFWRTIKQFIYKTKWNFE